MLHMVARLCAHQVSSLAVSDRSEMGAWKFAGHFFMLLVGWTWYRFRGKRHGLCQRESYENMRSLVWQRIISLSKNL